MRPPGSNKAGCGATEQRGAEGAVVAREKKLRSVWKGQQATSCLWSGVPKATQRDTKRAALWLPIKKKFNAATQPQGRTVGQPGS